MLPGGAKLPLIGFGTYKVESPQSIKWVHYTVHAGKWALLCCFSTFSKLAIKMHLLRIQNPELAAVSFNTLRKLLSKVNASEMHSSGLGILAMPTYFSKYILRLKVRLSTHILNLGWALQGCPGSRLQAFWLCTKGGILWHFHIWEQKHRCSSTLLLSLWSSALDSRPCISSFIRSRATACAAQLLPAYIFQVTCCQAVSARLNTSSMMQYENEDVMGEGLKEFLEADPQNRSKLFLTSKVWNDCHRPEHVRSAQFQSQSQSRL